MLNSDYTEEAQLKTLLALNPEVRHHEYQRIQWWTVIRGPLI